MACFESLKFCKMQTSLFSTIKSGFLFNSLIACNTFNVPMFVIKRLINPPEYCSSQKRKEQKISHASGETIGLLIIPLVSENVHSLQCAIFLWCCPAVLNADSPSCYTLHRPDGAKAIPSRTGWSHGKSISLYRGNISHAHHHSLTYLGMCLWNENKLSYKKKRLNLYKTGSSAHRKQRLCRYSIQNDTVPF